MEKEIIIADDEYEIRCAILEDGVLNEIHIERHNQELVLGNVYKGSVRNVLPGMQIAFVEIGLEKHAFLHASDLHHDFEEDSEDNNGDDSDKIYLNQGTTDPPPAPKSKQNRGRPRRRHVAIGDVLSTGKNILVQVIKEAIAHKGSRITTAISLPGRYVVFVPNASHIGVSRRIPSIEERNRLKTIARELHAEFEGGLIIRTVAEGRSREELFNEVRHLKKEWLAICENAEKVKAPAAVHIDHGFVGRIIRDFFGDNVSQLVIDSKTLYDKTMDYLSSALPELQQKVKFYDSPISVFEAYGIEKELRKAMQEKVWLKSGGYLVIQETEALVSVDVNTGKYVGEDDAMNTILNTNLEAVEEIVRQMRLRDLGGIIVIDFIDMDWRQHRQMVYRKFQKEIQKDRARTNILHISELGLVEMTRQRMRPSLASLMTDKCPYCEGRGTILATDTILVNLLRSVKSAHQRTRRRKLKVIANDQIINKLRNDSRVKRLERSLDIRLRLQNNVDLHLEDFHIYDDRDKEISLNW